MPITIEERDRALQLVDNAEEGLAFCEECGLEPVAPGASICWDCATRDTDDVEPPRAA